MQQKLRPIANTPFILFRLRIEKRQQPSAALLQCLKENRYFALLHFGVTHGKQPAFLRQRVVDAQPAGDVGAKAKLTITASSPKVEVERKSVPKI